MLVILAPVLVFGLVIFVHELGHFLAAKLVGVYAPRFSIGFGPALWHRRWGETEYVLGALPLGGYVRMASRLDEDMAALEGGSEHTARREDHPEFDPNAMVPFGPHPVPHDRLFENKPLLGRLLIMIAGVTMNVVLAVVVLSVVAWHLGRPLVKSRVVGVIAADSALTGLQALRPGDSILAVNGHPVATWNAVQNEIAASQDTVRLTTQHGEVWQPLGGAVTASRVVDAVQVLVPPVLDSIVPDNPAAMAGMRRGDTVVAVGGAPVFSWTQVVERVSSSPGKPVEIVLGRPGGRLTVTVTPRPTDEPDLDAGTTRKVGKIGVAPRDISTREQIGPLTAVAAGGRMSFVMAHDVVSVVRGLFAGRVSVGQLGGPIRITQASVQAARNGFVELFGLIAFLSINVAILNLFPIPILDGGQIVINIVEAVKGSPLSLRSREYLLRFGLVAIALLFLAVMYNDTREWIARLFSLVARLFG